MELERMVWKNAVREGYVVLLRAQAELLLPCGEERIREFYQKTARACLLWACEIWGEQLREAFCALEGKGRARFRTRQYHFSMRSPWEGDGYVCILCESTRSTDDGEADFHRISHVWKVDEQTALPKRQILQLWRPKLAKNAPSFLPDGFYREGESMIFFKNPTSKNGFLEAKSPMIE